MPPVQADRVELRARGAEGGGGLGGELAHEDGAAPRLGSDACGRAVVDRIEGALLEAAVPLAAALVLALRLGQVAPAVQAAVAVGEEEGSPGSVPPLRQPERIIEE